MRFLAVLLLCLASLPAAAQPDIPFPSWSNGLTGYVEVKEPKWVHERSPHRGSSGAVIVAPGAGGHVLASWYDCKAAGQCSKSKRTASGEMFNANAHTAAHRSLPFGTQINVCHRKKCTRVRINDRGPFVRGRSLDLSAAAARSIGMNGVGRVSIERL